MEQAKAVIGNVTFCRDAYECAEGASALVIVTEWEQFRALDFERLKGVMEKPVLVDLRNIYRLEEAARAGFAYESVGRASK
jgi:UDPglucose 6-dehydrogenase